MIDIASGLKIDLILICSIRIDQYLFLLVWVKKVPNPNQKKERKGNTSRKKQSIQQYSTPWRSILKLDFLNSPLSDLQFTSN